MNDIFSLRRFALLNKAFWMENRKRYIWFFILLITIALLILINRLIFVIKNHTPINQGDIVSIYGDYLQVFLIGALFLIACTSIFFRQFSKKENTIFTLLMPVTALERTSLAFIFTMIICPIIFIIVAYILDFLVVGIYSGTLDINRNSFNLSEFSFDEYFGFFTIMSVLIFGSVFFEKYGSIKTIFIVLAFFVLQLIIINQFMPEKAGFMGEFNNMDVIEKGTGRRITINGFMYYFKYLLFPLSWFLTYLRLKEREV